MHFNNLIIFILNKNISVNSLIFCYYLNKIFYYFQITNETESIKIYFFNNFRIIIKILSIYKIKFYYCLL